MYNYETTSRLQTESEKPAFLHQPLYSLNLSIPRTFSLTFAFPHFSPVRWLLAIVGGIELVCRHSAVGTLLCTLILRVGLLILIGIRIVLLMRTTPTSPMPGRCGRLVSVIQTWIIDRLLHLRIWLRPSPGCVIGGLLTLLLLLLAIRVCGLGSLR